MERRWTGVTGGQGAGGEKGVFTPWLSLTARSVPRAAVGKKLRGPPPPAKVPPLTPPFCVPGGAGVGTNPMYLNPLVFWGLGLMALVMLNRIQFQWPLFAPGGTMPPLTGSSVPSAPYRNMTFFPLPLVL